MRAIVQRVSSASVRDKDTGHFAAIGAGLVLLVGVHREDTDLEAKRLAEKIANLRVFNDTVGKMNISLLDSPGHDVLAVSNFTVYGETKKSRRPSFTESAPFDRGRDLFDRFVLHMRGHGFQVPTGVFGGDMSVTIVNDGPVTVIVDVEVK
jgi:D-tyrosyl-tRNA(Tyr) deacylase